MNYTPMSALMIVALLQVLSCCSIAPADASTNEVRLGVWRGTLGTHQVMVYLNPCNKGEESEYYYLNHRFGIALKEQDPKGAVWVEVSRKSDDASAQWKLSLPVGNHLAGGWVSADGRRRLPISLTRAISPKGAGNSCSGQDRILMVRAYDAPRVDAQELEVSKLADGLRGVSVLDDHVKMMELPDDVPHAATFNAAQHAWLTDNVAGYYGCALQTSAPPDYNQRRAIILYADTWVVVEESFSAYCGGPHPDGGIFDYQTWNLATGKIVQPWTWIKDSKVKCNHATDCGFAAPKELNAIILAQANNEGVDGCADAIKTNSRYLLRPSAKGLVFSTSFAHVIQACNEDFEIPYAQLQPYLTNAGKQAAVAIQRAAGK